MRCMYNRAQTEIPAAFNTPHLHFEMEKFSFSDKIRILIIHQTSAFPNLTLTLLYGLMRRRMMIGVIKKST